jgi:glycyl-tRNA synthetase beta chain
MPEFFLELFSEEIPARMQRDAAQQLYNICMSAFQFLQPKNPKGFYGPRRIAFAVSIEADDRAAKTDTAEVRGPRENAADAAIDGFLTKYKGNRNELKIENGYYILRRALAPSNAIDIIRSDLTKRLANFTWPKSMRWGQSGDFTWVRPLRRIVCLLDGDIIQIKVGPVTAGRETEGHRMDAGGPISISSVEDWQDKLRSHHVIVDQDERREKIQLGISDAAATLGLTVVEDHGLVYEVTGLAEWPVPLIGKIEQQFMSLPAEVRELSMKVNQRYFALRDTQGEPAPYFAFVANVDTADSGAAIITGNERVLRARLSDAWHFWNIDLNTPLNALLPKLDQITFHAEIGSQGERARRISKLAEEIANALDAQGYESVQARQAGLLCKADLVTGMVGEFPELQGIMGGYYAERFMMGWDGSVIGPAIRTHYLPKGPSDPVPRGVIAASVALADKIDTLVQFFRINEKPTGSSDPYALRRAALGVIRIILENSFHLALKTFLHSDGSLFSFIIERLRVKLRGDGERYDILDAVLGAGDDDDLVRIMERVHAVSDFLETEEGANLLVAYRRTANILKIEDAKDGPHRAQPVVVPLPTQEDSDFRDTLPFVRDSTINEFKKGNFALAMAGLARLRTTVDAFFEKVTVNAPEPELRLNRLRLLAQLRDTMHQIADFSKIVG